MKRPWVGPETLPCELGRGCGVCTLKQLLTPLPVPGSTMAWGNQQGLWGEFSKYDGDAWEGLSTKGFRKRGVAV